MPLRKDQSLSPANRPSLPSRISMIDQTLRDIATSCRRRRRRTDNSKYRRAVLPRGHVVIRRQFILKSRAIRSGLVRWIWGRQSLHWRIVKGRGDPEGFRPRWREAEGSWEWPRQFYGLAYRLRTGAHFFLRLSFLTFPPSLIFPSSPPSILSQVVLPFAPHSLLHPAT